MPFMRLRLILSSLVHTTFEPFRFQRPYKCATEISTASTDGEPVLRKGPWGASLWIKMGCLLLSN